MLVWDNFTIKRIKWLPILNKKNVIASDVERQKFTAPLQLFLIQVPLQTPLRSTSLESAQWTNHDVTQNNSFFASYILWTLQSNTLYQKGKNTKESFFYGNYEKIIFKWMERSRPEHEIVWKFSEDFVNASQKCEFNTYYCQTELFRQLLQQWS